jgi:hypothetical protein
MSKVCSELTQQDGSKTESQQQPPQEMYDQYEKLQQEQQQAERELRDCQKQQSAKD